jgi:sulfoquinovosyltransferase
MGEVVSLNTITSLDGTDNTSNGAFQMKDRPLRIGIWCVPTPITYLSGQSIRFRTLLQYLCENTNDKVHLVTSEVVHPDPPKDCFDQKIPILYTRGFSLPQYPTMTLSLDVTFKSFRLSSLEKFDLIHVSSPSLLSFWAIAASRIYRIPLVMSYHTHLPVYVQSYFPSPINYVMEWLVWKALRIVHSFADLNLCTSPQIVQQFTNHKIPRCLLWQKGIDTTKFHPIHKRSEMKSRMSNGHPEDFLLVYIGRLAKEKRLFDLKGILEQMNNEAASTTMTRLCIVGFGPLEEELREYFEGTPTVFLGRLDGDELSQAFASADVFCMPSDSETLGFVVLESMASQVPCVAARAGGLIDLIDHGRTGYLVPTKGDVATFVERIQELKQNPELYRQMAVAAREETELWSWQASMEKLRNEAYRKAIDNLPHRMEQRVVRWFGWNRLEKKHS